MLSAPQDSHTIGDWCLFPESGCLRRDTVEVRLTIQQQRLLEVLMARAGELVDKDSLFQEVWDGAAVEDNALARCVSELRRILGDDARSPRYIETLPKRGYRLIAPVESREDRGPEVALGDPVPLVPSAPRVAWRWIALVAVLGLVAAGIGAVQFGWTVPSAEPDSQLTAESLSRQAKEAANRGIQAARSGQFDESEHEFHRALALYRQAGDDLRVAKQRVNLARIHMLRNEWDEAATDLSAAEPVLATAGDDKFYAHLLVNLGLAHAAVGNLRLARPPLTRAAEVYRRVENPLELAHARSLLGEVLVDLGEPAAALEALEEALALREEHGDHLRIASSRIALAAAWIETGDYEAAISLAESVHTLDETKPAHYILAGRLVARAHLNAGRVLDARTAIDHAVKLLEEESDRVGPNEFVRYWLPVTVARVEAAEGRFEDAGRRLQALLDQPVLRHLRLIDAEARLAMAEVELAAGDVDMGSRRLAELIVEADGAGWKLISSKASRTSARVLAARSEKLSEGVAGQSGARR